MSVHLATYHDLRALFGAAVIGVESCIDEITTILIAKDSIKTILEHLKKSTSYNMLYDLTAIDLRKSQKFCINKSPC